MISERLEDLTMSTGEEEIQIKGVSGSLGNYSAYAKYVPGYLSRQL